MEEDLSWEAGSLLVGKKLPASYGTWKFIAIVTAACY
jgi:hypothetical protein